MPLMSVTHSIIFAIAVIFHAEQASDYMPTSSHSTRGQRTKANYCPGNCTDTSSWRNLSTSSQALTLLVNARPWIVVRDPFRPDSRSSLETIRDVVDLCCRKLTSPVRRSESLVGCVPNSVQWPKDLLSVYQSH
ncbi:hypothetical protein BDV32DRAFT_76066 [Aspergillus pseudonomiae]|nr:hypothetical protein BDV32DRAFT_76066 [Aspergillus pseudonomiae]